MRSPSSPAAWGYWPGRSIVSHKRPAGTTERSVHTQGGDGVDVGGAAGGNPAGDERDDEEQRGDQGEGCDVPWPDAVEQAGGEARGGESEGNADEQCDDGETHSSADDHGLHLGGACAEGHADADLAGALADGVAHDAV